MVAVMAAGTTGSFMKRLLFYVHPPFQLLHFNRNLCLSSTSFVPISNFTTSSTSILTEIDNVSKDGKKNKDKKKSVSGRTGNRRSSSDSSFIKRRTRSDKAFDESNVLQYGDSATHIPVMLGEVLEVFSSTPLRSFVDCTLGAAGHSSAIIQAHPEMRLYIGLDVDPIAQEMARSRITNTLHENRGGSTSNLKTRVLLKNFRDINCVLRDVENGPLCPRVDGILMDLGMSSMQVNNAERGFSVLCNGPLDMRMDPNATLRAEDIVNSWPAAEVGRILRDYGEESNWQFLQNKIVKARFSGGLHSTGALVDLIRNSTHSTKGGRHGWIKTATRVFQALRIAVNDELRTLADSLHACFDCLGPGGRLAVISFHSLEDRIIKQTFLDLINSKGDGNVTGNESKRETSAQYLSGISVNINEKETWIKQMIHGTNGTILTKRPITPTEDEERLNSRSRSAKLRVVQKFSEK